MNKTIKKWTLGCAALSLGCVAVAGALVTKPVAALAATAKSYYYYVNVGESEFTEKDEALGLGEGALQTEAVPDQAKEGNSWGYTEHGALAGNAGDAGSVFANYSVGAAYSFAMEEAGTYQLALLVEKSGTLTVTPDVNEAGEVATQEDEIGDAPAAQETQRRVLSYTVTLDEAGDITVATTGYQLYAIMIAPEDADVILDATWSSEEEGKVIVYGELLEKETAVKGFTSSGKDYAPVDYTDLPGGGGANLNFNGFTASGVIRGTKIAIKRYFAVMPKSLEYFVNAGSAENPDPSTWQYTDTDESEDAEEEPFISKKPEFIV